MTDNPVMDLERFPFETQRSMVLDYGLFPGDVEPGLSALNEGDTVRVMDCHGTTVARIPLYRLEPVDLKYLAASLASAVVDADEGRRAELDQAIAAVRAGEVFGRPDRDWLAIPTDEAEAGWRGALIVSRCAAVPSWTVSDQCDPDVARAELDADPIAERPE